MLQTQPDGISPTRKEQIFSAYRSVLPQTFRSPAFWCFVVIYLAAVAIYLPVGGSIGVLGEHLAFLCFFAIFLLAIIPLTAGAPIPAWENEQISPRRLRWQVFILCFFACLFVLYTVLLFQLLIPSLSKQNQNLFPIVSFSTPLLLLLVLPTLITRLLGSSWQALGFTRGYRSGWVLLVSCTLPLIVAVILVFVGHQTAPEWLANIVQALLLAGFPEEVFFRGLLFTRLYRLLGGQWSLFLSALIFGIAHLAVNLNNWGNPGVAFAECVLDQMVLGLVAAVIFLRSRSLLAGTIFHTLLDSLHV